MNKREKVITNLLNMIEDKTITKSVLVNDLKWLLSQSKDVQIKQDVLSFEEFWETYGKKIDTKKCLDAFNKITEEEARLIKETLPLYVKSTPDKKFRKNPLTYLNGKCWLDEVEHKQEKPEYAMTRTW